MGNVLVIDDEKPIALMITMALARYNFNVETAANAAEGLKKFDEGCFDLIITDLAERPQCAELPAGALYPALVHFRELQFSS